MKRLVVRQNSASSAGQPPMESRCCVATVNKFLSSSPPSIILLSEKRKKKKKKKAPRHRCAALPQTLWIQTPERDQPKKLQLSSSGKEGDTSAPCLFTFPSCQKRSESEDYSTLPEWNSMKALRWKQYHPYFKQLAPNRGNLTLGCQLFHFSGFLQQTPAAQVYFSNRTTFSCRLQNQQPTSSDCI